MAATDTRGTYSETAYVVVHDGTVAFAVEALLDTIDVDEGDKEVENKANLAGGRVEIKKPEEDTIVTFEGWFEGIGDTDDTAPDGLITSYFGTADTVAPFSALNTRARKLYNVFILWTDDTAATQAQSSIASGSKALRLRINNARMVSCKPSYTDKELKFTFKFRVAPYGPTGTGQVLWESTDGTASMASLATTT